MSAVLGEVTGATEGETAAVTGGALVGVAGFDGGLAVDDLGDLGAPAAAGAAATGFEGAGAGAGLGDAGCLMGAGAGGSCGLAGSLSSSASKPRLSDSISMALRGSSFFLDGKRGIAEVPKVPIKFSSEAIDRGHVDLWSALAR